MDDVGCGTKKDGWVGERGRESGDLFLYTADVQVGLAAAGRPRAAGSRC